MTGSGASPAPPAVTVTMLVHRSPATSAAALASVLADGWPGPLQVLVREQGGDAEEYDGLVAAAGGDPRVEIERGLNLGFCAGHDHLLRRATGDVVVLLNDDAVLRPGFLAAAVAAFDDPDVGSVQPLVLSAADPSVVDTAGLVLGRSRRVAARGRGGPPAAVGGPTDVWGADGAVLVLHRRAVESARHPDGTLLPAEFGSHMEDTELAWRLQRLGWRCRYVPDAVAVHARGTDERHRGLRARVTARRHRSRTAHVGGFVNLRLAQLRHDRPGDLLRDLPHWLPREVAAWVALVAVTPGSVPDVFARLRRGIRPSWRARRWFRARVGSDARSG